MSRKKPAAGPTISLFPFLAVLLCTMGALLVVLVLFSRSVRQDAVAKRDEAQASAIEELELARDSLAWRRDQMEGVRARTAEELATARLQLAGVEESIRGLQDEFAALERTAAALASGKGAVAADDETLRGLETRLTSSRESLDKARADRKSKPPAYAIVPYAGRNGTHRRPLYIECCGDGVFLQPEGIRLSPSDFEGPPGPGNPLASALRAAREQIVAMQGGSNDPAAQPYPLLIVRPSGVLAYYAAREAIQSWGSDFGYQLVDEDWTLQFPAPDPTLAQVERRAIEESRARLAWLEEVRPSRPVKPTRQYRAAPTRGGVVADGGPSVLGDQSRWDWANSQRGGSAAGGGGDPTAAGVGNGQGGGGKAATGGFAAGRGGDGAAGDGGPARGVGGSDGSGGDAILRGPGGDRGRFGGGGQAAAGPDGVADASGDRYGSGSLFTAVEGGSSAGANRGGTGTGSGSAGSGGTPPPGGAGGVASTGAAAGGGSGSGATTSQRGGSGGGGSGPAMPGLVQAGGGGQAGGSSAASASASMAQARGKNWASLATQDRPIPLTRPIRVECALHEFRILDDGGRRVETRIPIAADTAGAIDPLVAGVHERVQAWGIAGDRMYWRPQLVLSETGDGRSRREDLERLLADSGLDTRSRDGRDQIVPLPTIDRTTAVTPSR